MKVSRESAGARRVGRITDHAREPNRRHHQEKVLFDHADRQRLGVRQQPRPPGHVARLTVKHRRAEVAGDHLLLVRCRIGPPNDDGDQSLPPIEPDADHVHLCRTDAELFDVDLSRRMFVELEALDRRPWQGARRRSSSNPVDPSKPLHPGLRRHRPSRGPLIRRPGPLPPRADCCTR
jgi:hypothetical protein